MKITVSVCITEQQYAAIVRAAESSGLAKSDIIRRALDEHFAAHRDANNIPRVASQQSLDDITERV